MGYFANGTEDDLYHAEYCQHCLHGRQQGGCPITNLHLHFHYDHEDENAEKNQMLNELIPRIVGDGPPHNGECRMFFPHTVNLTKS